MTVSLRTSAPVIPNSSQLREELRANDGLYLTDPEGALQKALTLLEAAKRTNDRSLVAACQMELGRCYRQCSDLAQSGNAFRDALSLFTSLGDRFNIPKALHALGTIHSATGRLEDALRCYSGALPLAQSNEDWFAVQRIFNSWGIVAVRLGDYQSALQCFTECLELLSGTPDRYLESSVLANTGAIFERSEAFDKAMQHFERSLAIARELNDSRQIAATLIFMANTSAQLKCYDRAKIYAQESQDIAEENGFDDLASQSLVSLAELALLGPTPGEALSLLLQAREKLAGSPNPIHLQKVEHALGTAYAQLGNVEEAETVLLHALELANSVGSPQLLYHTYVELADLASKNHDYKQSNEYLTEALRQHELLHNERNQNAVSMLEFQMALETYRRNRAELAQKKD